MTPKGEERLIRSALKALDAGDPQPVLRLVERSIIPTDAPVVAQAWRLFDKDRDPVEVYGTPEHEAWLVDMEAREG